MVTTKEDISEVLKEELENGNSVDAAIDCLGGEIMGKCIHYLTHGARWIMIAALAGTKIENEDKCKLHVVLIFCVTELLK